MNTKKCCRCKELKDINDFNVNATRKDGHGTYCRECAHIVGKEAYQKQKEKYRKRLSRDKQKRREEIRQKLIVYLKEHPCCDCGITDIRVLTFDHLRDKRYNVSELTMGYHIWETISREIEKCEVVCANCHMIRTATRGNHWNRIDQLARPPGSGSGLYSGSSPDTTI